MRFPLLLAISLFPSAAWAASPQSAIDWLVLMSGAAHNLNYEGTFIYEHAGRLQTMQVFHSTDGQKERDRLVTLDGASREVVRDGGKVTCILPNHGAFAADRLGPVLSIVVPAHVEELENFYRPRVGGVERVAGHAARKIVIEPRDEYRYGQHLWLDEKSGLLLKAELRDEKERVVEQLIFTRLTVHEGPLPPNVLEPHVSGKDLTQFPQSEVPEAAASGRRWAVTRLPAGFHEEANRKHGLRGLAAPVEHHVFSDGLASVSVFIEAVKTAAKGPSRSVRKGALNVYTRHTEGHKITVLGDVPEATVRLIGDGVTAAEGGASD